MDDMEVNSFRIGQFCEGGPRGVTFESWWVHSQNPFRVKGFCVSDPSSLQENAEKRGTGSRNPGFCRGIRRCGFYLIKAFRRWKFLS